MCLFSGHSSWVEEQIYKIPSKSWDNPVKCLFTCFFSLCVLFRSHLLSHSDLLWCLLSVVCCVLPTLVASAPFLHSPLVSLVSPLWVLRACLVSHHASPLSSALPCVLIFVVSPRVSLRSLARLRARSLYISLALSLSFSSLVSLSPLSLSLSSTCSPLSLSIYIYISLSLCISFSLSLSLSLHFSLYISL